MTAQPEVDLVVNVFDRTIETVLAAGYFDMVANEHRFSFSERTLLINNVSDLPSVTRRASELKRTGEITRYLVVAEHVDRALAVTGLRRSDFGRYLHNSDCSLVAICADGPQWLCYVDAEARLRTPAAWIGRATSIMDSSPRLLSAQPQWEHPDGGGKTAAREADVLIDDVMISYGFSDQTFLVRRRDLQRPLLRRPLWLTSPGTLWHPSVGGYFLETIIEGYMRRVERPRLTVLTASTVLAATTAYEPLSTRERVQHRRNRAIERLLSEHDFNDPRLRVPLGRSAQSRVERRVHEHE